MKARIPILTAILVVAAGVAALVGSAPATEASPENCALCLSLYNDCTSAALGPYAVCMQGCNNSGCYSACANMLSLEYAYCMSQYNACAAGQSCGGGPSGPPHPWFRQLIGD